MMMSVRNRLWMRQILMGILVKRVVGECCDDLTGLDST